MYPHVSCEFKSESGLIKDEIINKLENLNEDNLRNILIMVDRENKIKNRPLSYSQRYCLFPIKSPFEWEQKCLQEKMIWSASELDFKEDREQFEKLPERFKDIFYLIMGFFASADALISENIDRFTLECEDAESSAFYRIQNYIEGVHQETYNKMLDEIIFDKQKLESIMKMVDDVPVIRRKAEYIKKYISCNESTALRYVAAAAMEGIFFMGVFAIIFYYRTHNYLPAFVTANEWIRRDESIHRDFYVGKALRCLSSSEAERAKEIICEAVEIECEYISMLLQKPIQSEETDKIEKITLSDIHTYVKMLGDQILDMVGINMVYNCQIVLPYVENTSVKTNFYEKKVSQYTFTSADAGQVKKKKVMRNIF
jgi:ribonucleoside-diphosphate reductase subunit M2